MPPISDLQESLTMEHAMLVLFISVATFMFLESFRFGSAAQTFPQLTTIIVIVFGLLVLFRDALPNPIRRYTVDPRLEHPPRFDRAPGFVVDERGPIITVILCIGYLVGSITIGLLWTSPLFVLAYMLWKQKSWSWTVILTIASFGIAYLFMTILLLPIHRGVIL